MKGPGFHLSLNLRRASCQACRPSEDVIARCRDRIDEYWRGVDEEDDDEDKSSSLFWELVSALAISGPKAEVRRRLGRLCFFAARRALPCWEIYCDGDGPRRAIEAVGRDLDGGRQIDPGDDLCIAAAPSYRGDPIDDCRFSDTSCAAQSAAHAAYYLARGDLDDAYFCVGYADMAFDDSPLGEGGSPGNGCFDFAVPIAFEGREMTAAEREGCGDMMSNT